MPLPVQCGHCGARYNVDDRLAGKRAKCKKCGGVLSIPEPEPLPVESDDPFAALEQLERNSAGAPAAPPPAYAPPPPSSASVAGRRAKPVASYSKASDPD